MFNSHIKKPVTYWLFLFVLCFLLISCQSETNDVSKKTGIRLVTLSPHLAELVVSAGAIENLVGVVSYSDFPEQVKTIQKVGDAFKLDYEMLVSLKPDYVITWKGGTPLAVIEKLKKLNIKIIETQITTLEDIPKTIKTISDITHTQKQANQQIKLFNQKLESLKRQQHQNLTTFIQTYHQPLYTVSKKHWISQAAWICGYENIFSGLKQTSVTVTLESVIIKNPQAIINIAVTADNQWQNWQELSAVKNNQIITINPDIISRPSMRILQGIEKLCQSNP